MMFHYNKCIVQLFVALFFLCTNSTAALADGVDPLPGYLDSLFKKAHDSGSPANWKKMLQAAKETNDTAATGSAYVFYIQSLSNMQDSEKTDNIDGIIENEIKIALDFLYNTKQRSYYFIVCNIYIDWLFDNKFYDAAQKEAANMYLLAMELEHPLGGAIALRVQGQIFYKMSLFEKAFSTLKEGLKVCPSYKTDMKTYSTAQSLCEWLIMTCMELKDYKTADFYADFYGDMLNYWKNKGWEEPTGHYDVTYLSFKAMAQLSMGNMESAKMMLNEAANYIRPNFPANAYEHYYAAKCLLLQREHKYDEAIAIVDTLLNTHSYYYPFYLRDLLVKAELLSRSGHSQESIELFKSYIRGNDSLLRAENIRQLDELRIQYQVEKAEDESHDKTIYLRFASIIIILISLLLTLYIVNSRKLKAYNKVIVSRLEEYDKRAGNIMLQEHEECVRNIRNNITPISNQEIMERVELYMRENHPFKNPAFNREKLAKAVNINERALSEAIKETNGFTVTEYINICRLDYSRQLLSSNSILPLKDIVGMCGFGTPRTFQRLFRDKYGMPPSHYRKIVMEEGADSTD